MKKLSTSKQMNGNAVPKINPRRLLFLPTCIQAIASRGLNNLLRQILKRRNLCSAGAKSAAFIQMNDVPPGPISQDCETRWPRSP